MAPRFERRTAPTANATVMPSNSPSGTTEEIVAVVFLIASARSSSPTPDEMSSKVPSAARRDKEHAKNAAKANLERRFASHDFARVGGETLRIGIFANALGGVIAVTGGREATGKELIAGAFSDRCGLTGEERLINFGAVGDDVAICDDLVAGAEEQEVALHDVFSGNAGFGAAADDGGPRAGERDQCAQRLRSANLLDGADENVRDDDDANEETVLGVSALLVDDGEHKEDGDQRAEHDVEERERVLANNLAVPSLVDLVDVGETTRNAIGDLGRR